MNDDDMIRDWVTACSLHLADTVEGLINVGYAHVETLAPEEQQEFKLKLLRSIECRLLDLASRVSVAMLVDTGDSVGDAIGHFADHVVNARDFQDRRTNPINQLLESVFEQAEQEATHRAAKRHSEDN